MKPPHPPPGSWLQVGPDRGWSLEKTINEYTLSHSSLMRTSSSLLFILCPIFPSRQLPHRTEVLQLVSCAPSSQQTVLTTVVDLLAQPSRGGGSLLLLTRSRKMRMAWTYPAQLGDPIETRTALTYHFARCVCLGQAPVRTQATPEAVSLRCSAGDSMQEETRRQPSWQNVGFRGHVDHGQGNKLPPVPAQHPVGRGTAARGETAMVSCMCTAQTVQELTHLRTLAQEDYLLQIDMPPSKHISACRTGSFIFHGSRTKCRF